jgi:hypothetical protein
MYAKHWTSPAARASYRRGCEKEKTGEVGKHRLCPRAGRARGSLHNPVQPGNLEPSREILVPARRRSPGEWAAFERVLVGHAPPFRNQSPAFALQPHLDCCHARSKARDDIGILCRNVIMLRRVGKNIVPAFQAENRGRARIHCYHACTVDKATTARARRDKTKARDHHSKGTPHCLRTGMMACTSG